MAVGGVRAACTYNNDITSYFAGGDSIGPSAACGRAAAAAAEKGLVRRVFCHSPPYCPPFRQTCTRFVSRATAAVDFPRRRFVVVSPFPVRLRAHAHHVLCRRRRRLRNRLFSLVRSLFRRGALQSSSRPPPPPSSSSIVSAVRYHGNGNALASHRVLHVILRDVTRAP